MVVVITMSPLENGFCVMVGFHSMIRWIVWTPIGKKSPWNGVPYVYSKCSLAPFLFLAHPLASFFSPSRRKPSFRLQYTFTSPLTFLKVFHHRSIANIVSNISLHNKLYKGPPRDSFIHLARSKIRHRRYS